MNEKNMSKLIKVMIIIIAMAGVVLCILVAPSIGKEMVFEFPELGYLYYPVLVFVLISAVPVYIALYKFYKITDRIMKNKSFTYENAKDLMFIGKLALFDCIYYMLGFIAVASIGLFHPGFLLAVLFILFVGASIAVLSITLSKLVMKAAEIKTENELTV